MAVSLSAQLSSQRLTRIVSLELYMIVALAFRPIKRTNEMTNKRHRQGFHAGLCALALVCSACSQNDAGPETDSLAGGVNEAMQSEPANDDKTSYDGDELSGQVSTALSDLADRTGIATNNITVRDARIVNWASSAVGCPEKDKSYTQAIVPGVLLLLEAGGKAYRYHGRVGGDPFHCPDQRAEAPAFGPGREFM